MGAEEAPRGAVSDVCAARGGDRESNEGFAEPRGCSGPGVQWLGRLWSNLDKLSPALLVALRMTQAPGPGAGNPRNILCPSATRSSWLCSHLSVFQAP